MKKNKIPLGSNPGQSTTLLLKSLPRDLKDILMNQWGAKQNPQYHPEGNSLKHIITVIRRAYREYGNDPTMIMAALFHDLGKMQTYAINPKTGQPTAHGHDKVSADLVNRYREYIESFEGVDFEDVEKIVKNHMIVKPSTWDMMRASKKEPIETHKSFGKLQQFTNIDKGGLDY